MELAELAVLVDDFTAANQERLAADKVAKELKKVETALHDRIIAELIRNEARMCAGQTKRVTLQTVSKPQAVDWPAIHEYMVSHDAMDLLQRRLAVGAIDDRIEEGEEIPGIEFIQVNKLSVAKL